VRRLHRPVAEPFHPRGVAKQSASAAERSAVQAGRLAQARKAS
jgi:hypothetical protein